VRWLLKQIPDGSERQEPSLIASPCKSKNVTYRDEKVRAEADTPAADADYWFYKRTVAFCRSLLLDQIFRVQHELDVSLSVHAYCLVEIHGLEGDHFLLSIQTHAMELSGF
jgi:hypothetical protein